MKILKYKKVKNSLYRIYLDDGLELALYEDVILKYDLLLKQCIERDQLDDICLLNQEYDVYYVALNSLKSHMRSVYELKEFLLKKEYPQELVEKAIDKLIKQGYLDDRVYAKSYINNQLITSSNGPYRIEKSLSDKKISYDIIKAELEEFTLDLQLEKVEKIVNKRLKSNNNRGGVVLKQKIFNDLIQLGYDSSVIHQVIDSISFESDPLLAKKEYDKLYKKYSRKYQGLELERKIQEKLYQKGLSYEKE